MSTNRVNTGDAGYVKLLREPDSGYGVPQSPGNPQPAIVYNQGGITLQDERETVPRRGVAGLGPMENIQLRQRAEGALTFDQEMQGHSPLLLGMFGQVETVGASAPYDNYFSAAKNLPTWNIRDHWPGSQSTQPQHDQAVFTGCWFNQATWAVSGGDPMTVEYQLLGAKLENPSSAAQSFDAKPYYPVKPQDITSITWGSTALTSLLHEWSLTAMNNGRADVYPSGLKYRQKPYRGPGGLMVEFRAMMYPDDTYYATSGGTGLLAAFLGDQAAQPLSIRYDRGSTERLIIYVPKLKISGRTLNNADHGANPVEIVGVGELGTLPFSDSGVFPGLTGQGTDVPNQMIGVQYSTDVSATAITP